MSEEKEPPLVVTLSVKVEGAEKERVIVHAAYSDESIDDQTLDKVRKLIVSCGVTETRARKIISCLNENSIVFREVLI